MLLYLSRGMIMHVKLFTVDPVLHPFVRKPEALK